MWVTWREGFHLLCRLDHHRGTGSMPFISYLLKNRNRYDCFWSRLINIQPQSGDCTMHQGHTTLTEFGALCHTPSSLPGVQAPPPPTKTPVFPLEGSGWRGMRGSQNQFLKSQAWNPPPNCRIPRGLPDRHMTRLKDWGLLTHLCWEVEENGGG